MFSGPFGLNLLCANETQSHHASKLGPDRCRLSRLRCLFQLFVCVCSATCVAALTSCASRCGRPSRPLYHTHTHWLLAACHRNILSFLLVSLKHLLPPSLPSHTHTHTQTMPPVKLSPGCAWSCCRSDMTACSPP